MINIIYTKIMKKIILTLILILTFSSFKKYEDSKEHITYLRIKSEIENTNTSNADRKLSCVYKYAFKYDIPPLLLHNLIMTESSYRQWIVNENTGCIGLGQINPKWWNFALWHIDDGKLGKHLNKHNITNTTRYYKRIAYGTELTAYVFSNLQRLHGDFERALYIYGGFAIENACTVKYERYKGKVINNGN